MCEARSALSSIAKPGAIAPTPASRQGRLFPLCEKASKCSGKCCYRANSTFSKTKGLAKSTSPRKSSSKLRPILPSLISFWWIMTQSLLMPRGPKGEKHPWLASRQFAFTPVALTKSAFTLSSFLTCASSSAGVRTSGSTPSVASFSCMLGAWIAFNVSR
jgi:hypothetical protein